MSGFCLGKRHMLSGKTLIGRLFEKGRNVYAPPVRCTYLLTDADRYTADGEPVRLLVSVSKRNHKRAVRRNKLKRRMKEAYRLNRHRYTLNPYSSKVLLIALVFTSKELPDYAVIEKSVNSVLRKVEGALAKGDGPAVRVID